MSPREPRSPAPANEADQEVGDQRQRPSNDSQAPDAQEGRGVDVDTGRPVRRDGERAPDQGRDGARVSDSDVERGSGAARGSAEGGRNSAGNSPLDE